VEKSIRWQPSSRPPSLLFEIEAELSVLSLSLTAHTMIISPSRSALRQLRTQSRFITQPTVVPRSGSLARLLSSLAILEQRDGKLNSSSLSAVTAAQKLGGSVTGLVAGKGAKAIADEAAKVKGLDKVIYIDSEAYDRVCKALNKYYKFLVWI
jgi:hypothetical protein